VEPADNPTRGREWQAPARGARRAHVDAPAVVPGSPISTARKGETRMGKEAVVATARPRGHMRTEEMDVAVGASA
jgi:hypothetical protein